MRVEIPYEKPSISQNRSFECTPANNMRIVPLTTNADGVTEPIIMYLADGNYVKTKITLCVDANVKTEDIYKQKPKLQLVVAEKFKHKRLIDIAAAKDENAETADATRADGLPDKWMLYALRANILDVFRTYRSLRISDVYLPELITCKQ